MSFRVSTSKVLTLNEQEFLSSSITSKYFTYSRSMVLGGLELMSKNRDSDLRKNHDKEPTTSQQVVEV